ncbi:MAG: precorrin-8X methylmutase [Proteobacteria bacterium]|nr:precorrin-8X methylmutase [Pseudomonadota bacterium]
MIKLKGEEIEKKSFEIIDKHIPDGVYDERQRIIVRKIIHTTADFSIRKNIYFSERAIEIGLENLKKGCDIYADVMMVYSGISPQYLENYRGKVICTIRDQSTFEISNQLGITRASASVRVALEKSNNIGIFTVGNAPTALFEILKLTKEGKINDDVLVIGACVGFVGAKEAKELLIRTGLNSIVLKGRRGGSPIAATILNGLFYLLKGGER